MNTESEQLTTADVLAMSWDARTERIASLVRDAYASLDTARRAHLKPGQRTTARCVMFSGGDDSTVLAHLFRDRASHAVHANTGIGIEETREYVRATCEAWGLPLIEKHAGDFYERWVVKHGFPGPAKHAHMYQRLKERCFRQAVRDLDRVSGSTTNRAIFIAGRRREESKRRETIPLHERIGTVIWVSPLILWTKADLLTYRQLNPDCPRNPVSANLHMSGECLCGCYAHEGELAEIGFFYPHVEEYIRNLEKRVVGVGKAPADRCQWGKPRPGEIDTSDGPACGNCRARAIA